MTKIEEILQSKIKPKEKQLKLVQAIVNEIISANELIHFFESAKSIDKGTCADVMKHVSKEKPEILEPYIQLLIHYINADLPRVKWGMSEEQLLPEFEKIINREKNNRVKNVYLKALKKINQEWFKLGIPKLML